jgi:ParB-like chromosome segregation protein Spo0J
MKGKAAAVVNVMDLPSTPEKRARAAREASPVSSVEWVPGHTLHANNYNPNHVAPQEMKLLKLSIMEDGFTQPIVRRPDGEIVDGFHRWTLGTTDPDLLARYGGYVPVVTLKPANAAHQMMSTIRHNRARGNHAVLRMADIVRTLAGEMKVPDAEIMRRLGMEDEEVERLCDTGGMTERGSAGAFGKGWEPR